MAHIQKRPGYLPPAPFWDKSKCSHLTAKRMNSDPALRMAPARSLPRWPVPPWAMVMDRVKAHATCKRQVSCETSKAEAFLFYKKSLSGYYLNNLKKKSIIGSSDKCLCSSRDFVSGVFAYLWIELPLFNQTIFRKRKISSPVLYMILGNTVRLL